MKTAFLTECRRCLARRAVRVLIGIAILGCIATGVIGLVVGGSLELTEGTALIRLADLWRSDDPVLGMPLTLLSLGALIGGAVVVGGEWKAGTVPTMLTWEPRRVRLQMARLAACSALAVVVSLALLVLFVVVGVLPSVLVHGEIGDVGGDWAWSLAGGVGRNLLLAGLAASLGGAVAGLGRSTTAAVAAVFVYEAVAEPIFRALWPERSAWLLTENAVAWATGQTLTSEGWERGVVVGGATLLAYVALIVAAAVVSFSRRDVAAA